MKKTKKPLVMAVSLALVAALGAGATYAWLTDTTAEVQNTFTVGNIDIELAETETDFKMVPGQDIKKDPIVTVKSGSEDCWVFVKVTEANDLADFIDYDIAEGWIKLDGQTGVYYREQPATTADAEYSVLVDDMVTVKEDVTKEMMDSLATEPLPTLTFQAYAIQKDGFATPQLAWAELT